MHSISNNKALLKLYAVALVFAVLIYCGTGDLIRALTSLLAFSPYAFVHAKPMAVSAAAGWLAAHGIRIRTSATLEQLSHMENIAFTTSAIAPTGTMQTDAPQLMDKLRRMGMHPVLLAPIGTSDAAQLAAQAGIRDIRTALPPSNDPFAVSTACIQGSTDNRSASEKACLHIVLGSSRHHMRERRSLAAPTPSAYGTPAAAENRAKCNLWIYNELHRHRTCRSGHPKPFRGRTLARSLHRPHPAQYRESSPCAGVRKKICIFKSPVIE